MRKIALFEEFEFSDIPKVTENDLRKILADFDAAKYFSVDLEKCELGYDPDNSSDEITDDSLDSFSHSFNVMIDPVAYKVDPKIFEEIARKIQEYILKKKREDQDYELIYDLQSLGFDENNAKLKGIQDIKKFIFKEIQNSPYWLSLKSPSDFKINYTLEQKGDLESRKDVLKRNFLISMKIESYSGEVLFDSDDFLDEMIDYLFYTIPK